MTAASLLFIAAICLFAALAIYFGKREEEARKKLATREAELNRRIYEVSVLKEVADRVGYSLDVEKIIDIITGSLRNLFPYSSASSLIIGDDELIFKTYVEERVSHTFIEAVKMRMLASLQALTEREFPSKVNESLAGVILDDTNRNPLASFFNIPLVINEKVVGLINVSSQTPGLYKEQEMVILYRITNQASSALAKLEEILETEKGKLLAMISSLADGVFMVDVSTKLLVINPKACLFLSIKAETPTIFHIIDSLTGKLDIRTKIDEAIKTNRLVEIPELSLNDKVLQVFITPVLGRAGRVIGAAVLLHDITAEKSLADLKEDFTNMMVHELRAPLTTIKQAASLLRQSQEKLTEAEKDKFLKMIGESSDNLLVEVSDLLDAAKVEAGRLSINPLPGDLAKVIAKRIEFFRPLANSKHITLTIEVTPFLKEFSFDEKRIAQVLNNLLSNAIKFTKEGGNIKVEAKEEDGEVTVSVSDTGVGIPREKQGEIFSKFTQLHSHTPPSTIAGTGLGLFITKGIVEAHGGKIRLASEIDKGTTIIFSLPEKPNLLN